MSKSSSLLRAADPAESPPRGPHLRGSIHVGSGPAEAFFVNVRAARCGRRTFGADSSSLSLLSLSSVRRLPSDPAEAFFVNVRAAGFFRVLTGRFVAAGFLRDPPLMGLVSARGLS